MATGVPTTATAKSPLIDIPEKGLRQIGRWGLLIATGSFLQNFIGCDRDHELLEA
jgi:hypothetical protein